MNDEPMQARDDTGAATTAGGIRFEIAPLPDRDVSFIDRLSEYPRGPDMLGEVLRAAGRTACVGLMRLQYRITVEGTIPNVPRLALAANHQSHLDALTVLAALPAHRRRELAVLAARDYFFSRATRGAAAGVFAAAVPFDRTRATELRSWARRLEALPRGTILFFPSGSRRRSEAQRGMLVVMARSGWPIVPVALRGTADAWPVGARVWRPFRRLTMTIGQPLEPSGAVDLAERLDAFWSAHR